jgi:BirA family biotin operon repressor/biotin-[acetyl-CoA-carboxylase] ligase
MTVIVDCRDRNPINSFIFNAQIALSCYDFFSSYSGDETSIKWPNDIYWRDRKAGGILIENSIRDGIWQVAFVGIGININQTTFSEAAVRPVSMKQITGKSYNPEELAKELCLYISERVLDSDTPDEQQLLEEYASKMFKRGESVVLETPRWKKEVVIKGVNRSGQLLVDHQQQEEALDNEGVNWIL